MTEIKSETFSPDTLAKLTELMRLHDEACQAAMALDGHCKSSEGQVEIRLTDYFERRDGTAPLTVTGISVYAYVVGPSRMHHFNSLDEALAAVRRWHSLTMEEILQDEREREAEGV